MPQSPQEKHATGGVPVSRAAERRRGIYPLLAGAGLPGIKGGSAGLRRLSLFVNIPSCSGVCLQTGYCSDVIEQAAAPCQSLAQNHPFIDGNKRTAITAAAVFLRLNGYKLYFDDVEEYEWMMSLYETGPHYRGCR